MLRGFIAFVLFYGLTYFSGLYLHTAFSAKTALGFTTQDAIACAVGALFAVIGGYVSRTEWFAIIVVLVFLLNWSLAIYAMDDFLGGGRLSSIILANLLNVGISAVIGVAGAVLGARWGRSRVMATE